MPAARAEREDPGERVELAAFAEDASAGHTALLARTGFEPVRHFFLMRHADLGADPRGAAAGGVRAPARRRGRSPADHRGRERGLPRPLGPPRDDRERPTPRRTTGPSSTPTCGSWPGPATRSPGVVQNWIWPEENERLGVKRGWLEHISVRRPWRRRGLARAITAASLVRLRDAGLRTRCSGVDSENPNGALGLYEGLGFEKASQRRPPTGATSCADRRPARLTTAPVVASWSHRGGGCDHAVLPDRGQRDPGG